MALSVSVASPQGNQQGSVFWIGANGNAYVKGANGRVIDQGKAGSNTASNLVLNGAKQIDDPNKGNVAAAPKTATGQVSTSSAPAKVVNGAAVEATNKAISSLDTERGVGLQNIEDSFNALNSKYDREAATNEANYNESSVTNNQNLQKNKQNALQAAAQGRRGLRGTLSSIGALSGDGIALSDNAVREAANDDIGAAADTYGENQVGLDKAIGSFRDEDKDRREAARTEVSNQRTALEGSIAGKRQDYLQKLAEIYNQGGDTASANNALTQAGNLNQEIATKSRVAAAPLAERSAAFTPETLENYVAGAGDMTVDVAGGDGTGGASTLTAGRRDRKKDQALVAA